MKQFTRAMQGEGMIKYLQKIATSSALFTAGMMLDCNAAQIWVKIKKNCMQRLVCSSSFYVLNQLCSYCNNIEISRNFLK